MLRIFIEPQFCFQKCWKKSCCVTQDEVKYAYQGTVHTGNWIGWRLQKHMGKIPNSFQNLSVKIRNRKHKKCLCSLQVIQFPCRYHLILNAIQILMLKFWILKILLPVTTLPVGDLYLEVSNQMSIWKYQKMSMKVWMNVCKINEALKLIKNKVRLNGALSNLI